MSNPFVTALDTLVDPIDVGASLSAPLVHRAMGGKMSWMDAGTAFGASIGGRYLASAANQDSMLAQPIAAGLIVGLVHNAKGKNFGNGFLEGTINQGVANVVLGAALEKGFNYTGIPITRGNP